MSSFLRQRQRSQQRGRPSNNSRTSNSIIEIALSSSEEAVQPGGGPPASPPSSHGHHPTVVDVSSNSELRAVRGGCGEEDGDLKPAAKPPVENEDEVSPPEDDIMERMSRNQSSDDAQQYLLPCARMPSSSNESAEGNHWSNYHQSDHDFAMKLQADEEMMDESGDLELARSLQAQEDQRAGGDEPDLCTPTKPPPVKSPSKRIEREGSDGSLIQEEPPRRRSAHNRSYSLDAAITNIATSSSFGTPMTQHRRSSSDYSLNMAFSELPTPSRTEMLLSSAQRSVNLPATTSVAAAAATTAAPPHLDNEDSSNSSSEVESNSSFLDTKPPTGESAAAADEADANKGNSEDVPVDVNVHEFVERSSTPNRVVNLVARVIGSGQRTRGAFHSVGSSASRRHRYQRRRFGCRSNEAVVQQQPPSPPSQQQPAQPPQQHGGSGGGGGDGDEEFEVLAEDHWLRTLCLDSECWEKIVPFEDVGKYRGKAVPFCTGAPTCQKVKVVLVMNYASTSPTCYTQILQDQDGYLYRGEDGLPAQVSWRGLYKVLVRLLKSRGYSFGDAVSIVWEGTMTLNRQPVAAHPRWCKDKDKNWDYFDVCANTDSHVKGLFSDIFRQIREAKEEEAKEEVVVEDEVEAKEEEVVVVEEEEKIKPLTVGVFGLQPFLRCVQGGGALESSWFPEGFTEVVQNCSLHHGSQVNLLSENQRDVFLNTMEKIASALVDAPPRDLSKFSATQRDEILPFCVQNVQNVQNTKFKLNSLGELLESVDIEEEDQEEIIQNIRNGREIWTVANAVERNQVTAAARYKCDKCERTSMTSYGMKHFECGGCYTCIKVTSVGGTSKWIKWIVRGYCKYCSHTNKLNQGRHTCPDCPHANTSSCTSTTARREDGEDVEPPKGTSKLWIKTKDGMVDETFKSTHNMVHDFNAEYEKLESRYPGFGKNDPQLREIVRYLPGSSGRRAGLDKISGPLQNGIVVLGNIKYHGVPILYGGDDNEDTDGDSSGDDDDESDDGNANKPTKKPLNKPANKPTNKSASKKPAFSSISKMLKQMQPAVAKKPSAANTNASEPTQKCGCKKGCVTNSCACRSAGKKCGSHCSCKNCKNRPVKTGGITSFLHKKSKSK